ncbi:MAG: bifunctional phosphoglucose/phosphomannose isomerase [Dehalococcoidales bacterium]|nr:bifunctional phosphoglucose/phosphomannose isomerase [Dehalococcoidales bacterium]
MLDLDDITIYHQFDTSGMLNQLHEFPEQCQRAWERVTGFALPGEYARINKVVILGMGGSAIAGEVVRRLALMETKVPVWVHRDYDLPLFVDESTLVIASSYSGNTEETLAAFTESFKTPAKKLALTTGGKLKQLAEEKGVPVFIVDYQAPPRVAFPHSFIPLVGILQKLGLLTDKSADLREALRILNKLAKDLSAATPLDSNPAKQLATRLSGRIAVIYGAGLLSEVAQRWKTQYNENSKSWAFYELFPELNHNAISGYRFPARVKEKILVLMLRSSLLHPRTRLRYEATAELLAKSGFAYEFIEAEGKSNLSQMMSTILLGDYVSFYLAILNKIDPTPVAAVDFVKNYLNQHTPAR